MSDDKKNEELSNELLDDNNGLDEIAGFDDLDESTGIDDFEDDFEDDGFEEVNDKTQREKEQLEKEQQLEKLDNEIVDTRSEIKKVAGNGTDTNSDENDGSSENDKTSNDEEPEKNNKFKINKFHIASGLLLIAGVFVITSKLSGTSTEVQPPNVQNKPSIEVQTKPEEKDTNKEATQQKIASILDNNKAEPNIDQVNNVQGKILLSEDKKDEETLKVPNLEENNELNDLGNDVLDGAKASALIDSLLSDRKQADQISIEAVTNDGKFIIVKGQNDETLTLNVGKKLSYYGDELRVDNILENGKVVLLSNGLYIDKTRTPLDKVKLKEVQKKKIREEQARANEIQEAKIKAEKSLSAKLNLEIEMYKNTIKELETKLENKVTEKQQGNDVQENKQVVQGTLTQAINRIDDIEKVLNTPKEPELLIGWSIKGSFKETRMNFVLNGYLIQNAYGDFYKVVVGDNFRNFGVVKGYDDNGKFFIGNHYIL